MRIFIHSHFADMTLRALALLLSAFVWLGVSPARAQAVANVEADCVVSLKITFNTFPQGRSLKNGAYETSASFASITLTSRDILSELVYDGEIAAPLAG